MSPLDRALPGGPDDPGPDEPAPAGRPSTDGPDAAPTVDLDLDLTSHEMLRRAHVLEALGPDWDPVVALRDEQAAYRLLYSGLDADQRRVYDGLVAAGVLPGDGPGDGPEDGGGHAAA